MIRRNAFDVLPTGLFIVVMALSACSRAVSTGALTQEHEQDPDVRTEEFLTALHDLAPSMLVDGEKLRVVATTSIVADVIANVGGESIDLIVLIPPGTDPHSFEPTPRDYQALTDAHVIFINGVGLEVFLHETLAQIAEDVPVVSISEGIELRQFAEGAALDHTGDEDEEQGEGEEVDGRYRGDLDPHVWFDPFNVMIWAENVRHVLGAMDSANADLYEDNTKAYIEALRDLHMWVEEMVERVPRQNRMLVTDHMVFNYFAQRYDFEMLGAVLPAYSTAADPSAQELAALQDAIRALDIRAVFVGESVNSKLAARVAEDTGVALVQLYTGSLSEPGGPAETYIDMMRFDVEAVVGALGQ